MDFGVAKKSVDHETGARTVAGTPAYMAPEQQKGFMRKQSDVYSLALCLYEALVGQVPWTVKGFDIANKKLCRFPNWRRIFPRLWTNCWKMR